MPSLVINVLGPFTAVKDGQPVSFSYDKVRALLAYLCVEHSQPTPRARLAGLLWPDQPQATAQDSLRQAISRLRSALDDRDARPSFLIVERDSIQLNVNSSLTCDLFQFQEYLSRAAAHPHRRLPSCATCAGSYINAIQLIRGSFLEDLDLPDSDLFDNWVTGLRELIQIQALEMLGNLAHFYERQGDQQSVLKVTARLIALDPYNEPAHCLAMLALARSGQRSQAVTQYYHLKQALESELGISPSVETLALFEQIKAGNDLPDPSGLRVRGLPAPLTPLVGRVVELSELSIWISDPDRRLISVVGPGGIGKSRLVNQASRQAAAMFADGAIYVPLSRSGSLADALAAALTLPGRAAADAAESTWSQVMAWFRRETLLVLDGFEHLLAEREHVSQLLEAHAGLVILITTRERLNLAGEWVFTLGGLEVPPASITDRLEAYSSVLLYCQCASQVSQSFSLNDANRAAVSEICRLVGGIPLAIRLAAAWTRSLSCQEIAAEIRRGLDILSRQPGLAAENSENSVRAVFEQSWKRLDPPDRSVFQRLSVFRGGFDRRAAEQVAAAAVESLSRLLDQSLLRMNLEGRYHLHDLLIKFGAEKLQQSGEAAAVRQRHFEYYYTLAQENDRQLNQEGRLDAFLWLIREAENLAEALAWAQASAPDQAAALAGCIHTDFHQAGVHLFKHI